MHGLGNKLITIREVLGALIWGWGAFWRHWAAVWERSCFLEYFMEGTKSLRCFMWQAEDGIQSQQTAEGLSRESLCLCRNAAQKNLNFLWVVLKNHWVPESKIINPTLELEHHLVPEQGTECHVQSFPEGWAHSYIWVDWFFYGIVGSWGLYFSLLEHSGCGTSPTGMWLAGGVGPRDCLDVLVVTGINPISLRQNFPKSHVLGDSVKIQISGVKKGKFL